MPTLKMYGASDDLVEAEGVPGCDEFDCYDKSPVFELFGMSEMLWIQACCHGSWAFAVGSKCGDDFGLMPNWPIRRSWGADVAYSETIEIDVPEGVTLKRIK